MNTTHSYLRSCSGLTGTSIEDEYNNKVGKIKDVVIDITEGKVSYVVVAVDTGFLNLGNKFFAIPIEAMEYDNVNERFRVPITKERLENSPGFDKDEWPTEPQPEFVDTLYNYYDVSPRYGRYSEDRAYGNPHQNM